MGAKGPDRTPESENVVKEALMRDRVRGDQGNARNPSRPRRESSEVREGPDA